MEPYRLTPSGRTASTVKEFLVACWAERSDAVVHMYLGYFEPWLRDMGRPDLADAAARIRASGVERDAGLEQFLREAESGRARGRGRLAAGTAQGGVARPAGRTAAGTSGRTTAPAGEGAGASAGRTRRQPRGGDTAGGA